MPSLQFPGIASSTPMAYTPVGVQFEPNEFWMLTLYSKSKKDNVPGHILKELLETFRDE